MQQPHYSLVTFPAVFPVNNTQFDYVFVLFCLFRAISILHPILVNQLFECPAGEFKCRSPPTAGTTPGNQCILNRHRCDGQNDCGDWSDEEGCKGGKLDGTCSSGEFQCVDGLCIPNQWRCDRDQGEAHIS